MVLSIERNFDKRYNIANENFPDSKTRELVVQNITAKLNYLYEENKTACFMLQFVVEQEFKRSAKNHLPCK